MSIRNLAAVFVLSSAAALHGCTEATSLNLTAALGSESELSLPDKKSTNPMPIPKFEEIAHVPEKKSKFFSYLEAKVDKTNDFVWAERNFVIAYREKLEVKQPTKKEQKHFQQLVERYGLADSDLNGDALFDALLTRVDVVPASLVLAQGANESAWGTSRFAKDGRNFFGIWCYREGCGIKPRQRNKGASHEVRKFRTVQEGVDFYVHNINIGHAYDSLRSQRAGLRSESEKLSGIKLATGLSRYSERGLAYVEEIQRMIEVNDLSQYNKVRSI